MNLRRLINCCLFILLPFLTYGEVVFKGNVTDPEGKPLQGIIVRLYEKDKLKAYSTTQKNGSFIVKTDTITYPATIAFLSTMFEKKELTVENCYDLLQVTLQPEAYTLKEVTVNVPHARVKGDTITYDVASYTNKGDRSIEDVIRKLPGVAVEENGTITYDGEPINNFYIEGLNLMGDNYAIASRNIRPEDIASVSVYERHQPKRVLKNVKDSKKAALDLKLKKSRMIKPVGYLKGGAGVGDDMLWNGALYGMFVAPDNQTIVQANGNNNGTTYYSPRQSEDAATSVFSQTPFGVPSISQSRYLFNKSAYFTANTLIRPKKDFTITLNTSYALDHSHYDGKSVTEYLGSDLNQDIIYSESVDNALKNHVVTANAKVERNSDKFYFSDQLSFGGSFSNNAYDILSSDRIRQTYKADFYNFANMLSTAIRHGKRVFEIESQTIYRRSPLNRIAATDEAGDNVMVRQTTSGHSFFNRESTSFSRLLSSRHIIGVNLSFEATADKFSSNGTAATGESDNDVSGYNIVTSASPFYRYSVAAKFGLELSLPLRLHDLKYTDLITDKVSRSDKLLVDMISSIFYKINQFQHADVSFGWNHSWGGIKDFILNPIYTTYRNVTTLGNGELNEGLNKYVQASYSYNNPLESLYGNVSVMFNRRDNNSLSVQDVSQLGTTSASIAYKSHINSINLMLNLTKNIRPWHTSFSLNGTGIFMARKARRAALTLDVRSNTYMVAGKVETHQFNDIVSLTGTVSYNYTQQNFRGVLPDVGLDEISAHWKISVFPFARLEIYTRGIYNRSKIGEGSYKGNMFIDAGARYGNKRYEIELTANNLANTRRYAYTLYRSLDVISYSYGLRPIEFMLSFRYNF